MATEDLPPGRLMRAASQAKTDEAENATSRLSFIWKCQVRGPEAFGRLAGSLISDGERIITVLSDSLARARRACSAGVSTSLGFTSSPEPATSIDDGTVT